MLDTLLAFFSRLSGLFGRRRAETEFDDEIGQHLELLTADYLRRGMAPQEARLAALRSFGGVAQVRETQRELRAVSLFSDLLADVRYACRSLRKNPGFTIVAVLTLALGIGVNTTLFSAFNAVALKPLPVADSGSVVRMERWFEPSSNGNIQYAFSYPEYLYFREQATSFGALAASSFSFSALSGQERLLGQTVSGNYFGTLGIHAVLGRTFLPEEDSSPGAHPVIVLSHNFWDRRYGRDPGVLQQTLKLNGTVYTIVGVAPEEFPGTAVPAEVPDFWAPIAMHGQLVAGLDWRNNPAVRRFILLGRLAPTTNVKSAQAQVNVLMARYQPAQTETEKTIALTLQRPTYLGNTEDIRFLAMVAALMLIVGLVWMIACANLANMLLARAASRQREIAVRLALGAGRGRIVRQLLTESTVLAVLGGGMGLAFSSWAAKLLWVQVQQTINGGLGGMTMGISLAPDLRVFGYALALALITGVVFGLSPALQFTKNDLTSALKQEGATFGRRLSRSRFRSFLVTAQVTASMLLLIIAGLLVRGLLRSHDAQPGFDTHGLYLVNADFGSDPQLATAKQQAFYQRLLTLPAVRAAGIGALPMSGTWTPPIKVGNTSTRTLASYASAGYMGTLGIPFLRGHDFPAVEEQRNTAIVSEKTARELWPSGDPIGQRFQLDTNFRGKFVEFEVIGVVADIRFANLSRVDPMHVYLKGNGSRPDWLMVRMQGDAAAGAAAIRAAVGAMDPSLPPSLVLLGMEQGPLHLQRVLAGLYAQFAVLLAALAVTLAGIGIYGVMSYLVNRRVKEIGILMALGADGGDVLRGVILQGLRPVIIGSLLGLLGAAGLSKVLNATLIFPGSTDVLYGMKWWDPATFLGITTFLAFVAALASYVPARRALAVDPMTALRNE